MASRTILLTILLFEYLIFGVTTQDGSIVQLPQLGEIQGTVESFSSGKYFAFRGIPYAKPPTDILRLKEPEKHEGWNSKLDATKYGSVCPQWSLGQRIGQEDCLFINVFAPDQTAGVTSGPNPVMVFIHGGNFQRGSSNPYGPNRLVQKGVVLVTFNYRLGVLGFLSTGDASLPGNLGLKDQVMALQWIRDNIRAFGGDPDRITLFGQDAGAASVFLHIISPMSTGLFHRAITQSGSPLCDWVLEESPHTYATEVARRLSCNAKSTSAMVDCIRKKSVEDVLNAQKDHKTFGNYPYRAIAVVEKEGFLPDTPEKLLKSGNFKIPLISGVNKDDGAFLYTLIDSYRDQLKANSSFLETQLIPMFVLTATDIRGNIESVAQVLKFEYFNGVDTSSVSQVIQPFINMSTDALFLSCHYRTLQLYSSAGATVHMYTFEYKGGNSMLNVEEKEQINYTGVSHGDELLYLFNMENAPLTASNDLRMAAHLLLIWTTFAETGIPPAKDIEFPAWEPYTKELKSYYQIDIQFKQIKDSYRQRYVELWLDLIPALATVKPIQRDLQYSTGGFGWAMFAVALILLVVAAVLAVMLFRKSKSQYYEAKTSENT